MLLPNYNLGNELGPFSGVHAQFMLLELLRSMGMPALSSVDIPPVWRKAYPSVQSLAEFVAEEAAAKGTAPPNVAPNIEEFLLSRPGGIIALTPEFNVGKLFRDGNLGPDSPSLRWVLWVLGLSRPLEKLRAERMRVVANVHYHLKMLTGPGAVPLTAPVPRDVIRGALWPAVEPTEPKIRRTSSRDGIAGIDVATPDRATQALLAAKEDLVLVDRDALDVDVPDLRQRLAEIARSSDRPPPDVILLSGFSLDEVRSLYRRAKATVDSTMLGGEAINFEAPAFGAVPLVADQMVGASSWDDRCTCFCFAWFEEGYYCIHLSLFA
jgi:hypothetical protein